MKKNKIVIIFILSFFLQGFPFFDEPPIVAKLSKATVQTGEVFLYTITVTGTFKEPILTAPNFNNLKVISQKQSKEYIKIKNKKQLKTEIEFSLFSHEPRVVRIGSALLKDGKRRFKSKGLIIKVIGKSLRKEKKIESYIRSGKNL